jgi:hypothetical protein
MFDTHRYNPPKERIRWERSCNLVETRSFFRCDGFRQFQGYFIDRISHFCRPDGCGSRRGTDEKKEVNQPMLLSDV